MATKTDIYYSTILVTQTCGECGVPFALPETLDAENRKTGKIWYCPNGHSRVYRETSEQILRREHQELEERLRGAETSRQAAWDQAQAAERRRAAAEGQVTKVKNRVTNGVCPCCNRSFANLHRHMSSKHPGFGAEPQPEKEATNG